MATRFAFSAIFVFKSEAVKELKADGPRHADPPENNRIHWAFPAPGGTACRRPQFFHRFSVPQGFAAAARFLHLTAACRSRTLCGKGNKWQLGASACNRKLLFPEESLRN